MSVSLQNGLTAMAAQIDAPVASFFNSCVHCGMCAGACPFYVETGDPRYTPIHKLEPLRRIWKREYTFWGRLLARFGFLPAPDDDDLAGWQPLLYDSCTLCGRCSLVCPVGNDITYMIRKAREGMVAAGHAPAGLKTATYRALTTGSPMGVKYPAMHKMIAALEKSEGIEVPFDRQGAEYLLVLSSNEYMLYSESIAALARIFHQAGVSWTLSSEAYEATNAGIQIGSSDLAKELLMRIVDAAEKLGVKAVISPECGHAYTALRWEGPNLIGRPYRFKVVHVLELLDELQQEGRLRLAGKTAEKLTFHDPCQLVRRGGILDQPRRLLNLSAEDFEEMACAGNWNWCCGGGGGVSANPDADDLRRKAFALKKHQFDETGARKVVTACANCRTVLEDGIDDYDMDLDVIGMAELLAENLATANEDKPT
ncbi:MAG TPA: (Fe-S)-binding protein [Gammaproteobacteria bacterium]|nr:(Fe-S)-binding protein [Gammaproteobacteria bacterium]